MIFKLLRFPRALLHRAGQALIALSKLIPDSRVDILDYDGNWVTCRVNGIMWRLDIRQYVDSEILKTGIFEPHSTHWVHELVKPGMIVADVGANFGYYTVQLSRLVGSTGLVHAFEPSTAFRQRLLDHLKRNRCSNVTVSEFGLSDRTETLQLYVGADTATLHWCDDRKRPVSEETVPLMTLDEYAEEVNLPHLDFIKVDIDGHEPRFLSGATQTIQRFRPIMLIEFAQLYLPKVGSDAEKLAEQLNKLGYILLSERTGQPFSTHTDFLIEAMNCAYSANILCFPKGSVNLSYLQYDGKSPYTN
jgi:FkbM family methyltransferase